MKIKTSITLSPRTVQEIDEIAGPESNRSRVIERAVREFVERHRRQSRDARDLEIINQRADDINESLEDLLKYQVDPRETR